METNKNKFIVGDNKLFLLKDKGLLHSKIISINTKSNANKRVYNSNQIWYIIVPNDHQHTQKPTIMVLDSTPNSTLITLAYRVILLLLSFYFYQDKSCLEYFYSWFNYVYVK